MRCQWKDLLNILPPSLRGQADRLGKERLQEVRLRIHAPPELVLADRVSWLKGTVTREDLQFVVNTASRYSPWCAATLAQGYLTAPGGHRIGICGEAVCREGMVTGIREVHSLCIRVARDLTGLVGDPDAMAGSVLILGAPGWGKTTLLRDLARRISEKERVCVVDERRELFPEGFSRGDRMDVLTGCPKAQGIEMLLRTMGPDCIAVDEITAREDCQSLIRASGCGVRLMATAHASGKADFLSRGVYRPLVEAGIVDTLVTLGKDKTYTVERMTL